MGSGEVRELRRVRPQVVQLPLVVTEGRHRIVEGDDLPAVPVEAAVAEHLVVLLDVGRDRLGIGEHRREAHAGQRLGRHPVARRQRRHACQLQQRGEHVGHVRVLVPPRPGVGDAVGDLEQHRHLVTAGVGVDLVQPERRVAHHRPPAWVVRHRRRAADLVDPRQVRVEVGLAEQVHVVRRRALGLTLARRAVVRGEQHDRVLELVRLGQARQEAAEALVDGVDHAGVGLHVAGEEALVVGSQVLPGRDVMAGLGVPRRQLHPVGHQPEGPHPLEALGAHDVPARVVAAPVASHVLGTAVERRVHRAVGQVQEERAGGIGRLRGADHLQRPLGDVVGEVVVLVEGVHVHLVVVLHEPVRLVQVREPVEDPVEAVEAALARPGVTRSGIGAVRVLGQVPLAHHEGGVAGSAVRLGRGGDVGRELHRVAGEPGIAVRDVAHAGPMRVHAGQQRRPRRRAHRRRVVVGEPQPALGEGIQVRRGDLGAVAAEVAVAEVVGEDDHDVRRTGRRRRWRRPPALGAGHRPAHAAAEPLVGIRRASPGRPGTGRVGHQLAPPRSGSMPR